MHLWIPLRHFLTLSAPLRRGPATSRVQQRRQQLLEQQEEQRTPSPRPATPGSTEASETVFACTAIKPQSRGPRRRLGSGFFANPMRPPEAVEGGNALHTQFIKMHREKAQRRVIQQMIALRKQRQQLNQIVARDKRDGSAGLPSGEATTDLPLALAEAYVHHEHNVRQLTPRPHFFVTAHIKDLLAGATAMANPLYPPSAPLGDEEGATGAPLGALSEVQLRKLAGRVKAPGLEQLHAETDNILSKMTMPPQDFTEQRSTSHESSVPDNPSVAISGPPGASLQQVKQQDASHTRLKGQNEASISPGDSTILEPWEVPCRSGVSLRTEGAPSVVMAAASRQMRNELVLRGKCDEKDETTGISIFSDAGYSPTIDQEMSSVGRSRPRRSTSEACLAEAAVAPFWEETRKALEHAVKARDALLGDSMSREPMKDSQRGQALRPLVDLPDDGQVLYGDPFADSKATKAHPELSALWEAKGARFGLVRDCRVPISYGVQGSTLAAYSAARRGCSLFDVSFRRLWEVGGRDRLAFLDLVTSCDLQRQMRIGDAQPALLLDSKGLVLDDCIVAKRDKTVEVWGSGHAAWHVFEYLTELTNFCRKSGMDISLQPSAKTCVLALQGPQAMSRFLQQAAGVLVTKAMAGRFSPNADISIAVADTRGEVLTMDQIASLPFMSTWGIELAIKNTEG